MLDSVNTDFEEALGGLDAVTRKTKELIKKSGMYVYDTKKKLKKVGKRNSLHFDIYIFSRFFLLLSPFFFSFFLMYVYTFTSKREANYFSFSLHFF